MNNIIITGDINSGKSTSLLNSLYILEKNKREKIGGIICRPYFKDNNKYYNVLELSSGNEYFLNTYSDSEITVEIGRFKLLKSSLNKMNNAIIKDIENKKIIIIDEFGRLELNGNGLIKGILYALDSKKNLIIIIRENIIDKALKIINRPHRNTKIIKDNIIDNLKELF